MKIKTTLSFLILSLALISSYYFENSFKASSLNIADGVYRVTEIENIKTIKVFNGSNSEQVQLVGLDFISKNENSPSCENELAANYLNSLIAKKLIRLEADESLIKKNVEDFPSKRLIFLPNGKNINLSILEAGYAKLSKDAINYSFFEKFKEAEDQAKNQKLGLWGNIDCQ